MDKYDELKYNPQFLKKAYDLVKEDFPKLFKDDNNYTKEDEKNWDIALDRIYDNFVTPEEQDFIEIWGDTDGTIGLIDHIYKNKNKFESFGESTNKYIRAFRESCKKLEEDDGNPSRMQALNYDIDNEELQNEQENLSKALGFLGRAYYLIVTMKNKYPGNKKIINLLNKIKDSQAYIEDLRTNPDNNMIQGFYQDPFDRNQEYKYKDFQNDDYKYLDKNYDKAKERDQKEKEFLNKRKIEREFMNPFDKLYKK